MILVWVTRSSPIATARSRTRCRARTTSESLASGSRSASTATRSVVTATRYPPLRRRLARRCGVEHAEALIERQGGRDPRQRQAELDEGDRDRRTHAHDGDLRAEDPHDAGG